MMQGSVLNSRQIGAPESVDEGTSASDGPNPLNVPVILRQIFLNLPTLDLITCSEVNKLWNYEARTVLRDFRTCIATNKGPSPCRSLCELDADLSRMTILPYKGLRLRIPDHNPSVCAESTAEFNFLLKCFNLKVLKIEWEVPGRIGDTGLGCPSVLLLTGILKGKHGDTIEEINFLELPSGFKLALLIRESFPKLKILRFSSRLSQFLLSQSQPRLGENEIVPSPSGSSLTRWLDAAPNLETLCVDGPEWAAVLPNLRRLLQNLRYQFPLSGPQERNQEFASSNLKVEQLTVYAPDRQGIAPFALDHLQVILRNSAKALNYLSLDLTLLPMFRSMNIQPLESLDTLVIETIPGHYEDQALIDDIRRLNFNHLFPRLYCVTFHEKSVDRRWPRTSIFDVDREEDAANSSQISKLNLENPPTCGALLTLASVFPHITTVTLVNVSNRGEFYLDLWSSWGNLRSIEITQPVTDPDFNLDSEFCGIFKEELGNLRRQGDVFLKRYDLIPDRPGLSNLKSLTQLHVTLRLHGRLFKDDFAFKNPNFFLSKVTGHCLLSKLKDLQVTVECNHPEAVKHLSSFVKIK